MNESFFSLLYRHTILALHTVLYCVAVPVLVLLHRFYRLSVMCDFGFHFISHEYGFSCVVLAEAGGTDKADVTSFFAVVVVNFGICSSSPPSLQIAILEFQSLAWAHHSCPPSHPPPHIYSQGVSPAG